MATNEEARVLANEVHELDVAIRRLDDEYKQKRDALIAARKLASERLRVALDTGWK